MDREIRPTRAEIDLGAIRANVETACGLAGAGVEVMAVVKADAYGHGALPVAQAALEAGASWLGVAIPEEGIWLREAGIEARILVLGPAPPEQADLVVRHGLDQCVTEVGQAETLNRAARRAGQPAAVHLKVDTGMRRVGVSPAEVLPAAARLSSLDYLRLDGLMTHLAEADAEDPAFTQEQLRAFREAEAVLRGVGIRVPVRHAANSAGLVYHPEARLDLVRPGIMLYGCPPAARPRPGDPPLVAALRFRTEIVQLKDVPTGASISYGRTFVAPRPLTVATLPVGYADGLSRLLSNVGQVLVGGRRAPILGRICMDMTMVDVTGVPGVAVGDEAVLIGRQGDDEITADEHAAWQGTISYEVLCAIGPRVPRVYRATQEPPASTRPSDPRLPA
jgi:alanine racemase